MSAQLSLPGLPLSREFLLAGRAIFTVVSPTGTRYTFRVKKKEFKNEVDAGSTHLPMHQVKTHWFVQLLTGPENTHDYTYIGTLDPATGSVRLTGASRYTADSQAYRAADWVCRRIITQTPLPEGCELMHAGRCGRCGRLLTVPESIKTGLGPECAGRVS